MEKGNATGTGAGSGATTTGDPAAAAGGGGPSEAADQLSASGGTYPPEPGSQRHWSNPDGTESYMDVDDDGLIRITDLDSNQNVVSERWGTPTESGDGHTWRSFDGDGNITD
jgi:hypothetical protein